jgi:hypothetical protein
MALRVGSVTPRFFASVTVSPSAVNANSTSRETYTVNGLATDMCLYVNQISTQTGLFLVAARVSAANTLQLDWWNSTGASITPTASQEIRVVAF